MQGPHSNGDDLVKNVDDLFAPAHKVTGLNVVPIEHRF